MGPGSGAPLTLPLEAQDGLQQGPVNLYLVARVGIGLPWTPSANGYSGAPVYRDMGVYAFIAELTPTLL